MKHYKSVVWKHPLMTTEDTAALVCLRAEAGLRENGELFEPEYECMYVNSYVGPELSKNEQEVLLVEEYKKTCIHPTVNT